MDLLWGNDLGNRFFFCVGNPKILLHTSINMTCICTRRRYINITYMSMIHTRKFKYYYKAIKINVISILKVLGIGQNSYILWCRYGSKQNYALSYKAKNVQIKNNPTSTYHICNFIFFPSRSIVRILKSMPEINKRRNYN